MGADNVVRRELKPDTKDHMLQDSMDMKCPEEANPETNADEWQTGAGERGE